MANKPLKSITFPGLTDKYTVPQIDNTLAVSGAAADAKKTGDEITNLKADLNANINALSDNLVINLYDKTKITEGYYKRASNGTIGTLATWFYSDVMPVIPGKQYVVSGNNTNSLQFAFYKTPDVASFVSGLTGLGDNVISFLVPDTAKYVTLSGAIADADSYTILSTEYIPDFSTLFEYIKNISDQIPKNLFDKNTITTGKYKKASDGTIGNAASFFYSDLIPVNAGDTYFLNRNNQIQIAFYSTPLISSFVSGYTQTGTEGYSVNAPESAKYMTISGRTSDADTLWVTKGFTSPIKPADNMIDFLDNRYAKKAGVVIEVGESGYDYNSVLEAVEYVRNNAIVGATILIHKGEYDLISELVSLRGQSFIDNYTQSEYTSPTGLKGLFLGSNIHVIGDNPENTIIECRYTGENASFKGNWSVFHVYNTQFTLENLTVIANNVRYCLHDDSRVTFGNETGIIKNCTFINELLNYGALIGAGVWGNDVRYISNCKFYNNQSDGRNREAISYHPNTGSYDCMVDIDNVYCENCGIQALTDGTNNYTMKMFISNSKLKSIPYIQGSGENEDVTLEYWNIDIA